MTNASPVPRDRTTNFSWAEMSSLLAYLRQEVEAIRAGSGRAFDDALTKIRKPLERLAGHGGDPRFVMVTLVSARWRSVRSPGRDIERGRRLLKRLASDAEVLKLLEGVTPQLKSSVEQGLKFLEGFRWQDRGPFDSWGTRWQHADRRRESAHLTRAAAVLDWHLRRGTSGRWHRRELLAQLLDGMGLLRYRRGGFPVEQVNRRLGRIKDDYYQRFAVPAARLSFHDIHRTLAITLDDAMLRRCGPACPEIDPPDDPLSQGRLLQEPAELGIADPRGPVEDPDRKIGRALAGVEVRVTILDKEPFESDPAPPTATGAPAGSSGSPNASRTKTRRHTK